MQPPYHGNLIFIGAYPDKRCFAFWRASLAMYDLTVTVSAAELGHHEEDAAGRANKKVSSFALISSQYHFALYARIDQQAPRVIALLDEAEIGAVQSSNETAWRAEQEAVIPRDNSKRLYVGVTGTLINEGTGTARVTLNGAARWVDEKDKDDEILLVGPIVPSQDARILRPGEQIQFFWSEAHFIEDWVDAFNNPSPANPRGACFMDIISTDYFEEGVIDHIFLEMSGRPIVPIDGDASHWHVPAEAEFTAISYPIKRAHVREENNKISPSWLQTYQEWNKLHGND